MLSVFVLAKNARYAFKKNFLSFNVYKLCELNFSSISNLPCNAVDNRKYLLQKCRNGGFYNLPSRYFFKFSFATHLKNAWGKFRNWQTRDAAAMNLYKSIESIDLNEFYSFFGLPDTFSSWFVICELHIWILLSQLKINDRTGVKFRDKVVNLFWCDVKARLEDLVSTQKNIKHQLKELYSRFPISLCIYDEGLLTNDAVLASALWYTFFEKCCDDPRKLEVLVSYIRHQVQHLSLFELESAQHPKPNLWLPLTPHIKAVSAK